MYSGPCAGAVFGRLAIPPVIVILAPNHTGFCDSPGASLWREGAFSTPLGELLVEGELACRLEQECELVRHDPAAHRFEHAIEVILPFLQVLAPGATIVPLVLAWDDWARCECLGTALAAVCRDRDVLLIASTDMNHYESAEVGKRKDRLALDAIEALEGRRLLETCRREQVTMCGRAAAAVVLEAARRLGATRAEVVDYRHSGWVTEDDRRVVGYAGVLTD